MEQATKPQTVGVGLNDSPAGLLAWIVEKFRGWSDCDGDPEQRLHAGPDAHQRDDVLGHADDHLVGAALLGAAAHGEPRPGRVDVPTGIARYSEGDVPVPAAVGRAAYNVTYWSEMPRGGHFAAWSSPSCSPTIVRTFFRTVR